MKPSLAWIAAGLLLLAPALGSAQAIPVTFHWSAPHGGSHVELYRVYQYEDSSPAALVATEADTTFLLLAQRGVSYRIQVSGVDAEGREGPRSLPSNVVYFELPQTESQLPETPALRPNYPNPFNPTTTIVYGVPASANGVPVALDIYDLRGQRVRRLATVTDPGWHETVWDGRNDFGAVQSSGQYVVRLACGGAVKTWKMTMLK